MPKLIGSGLLLWLFDILMQVGHHMKVRISTIREKGCEYCVRHGCVPTPTSPYQDKLHLNTAAEQWILPAEKEGFVEYPKLCVLMVLLLRRQLL